ncbi:MAG: hypothetical protein LBM67_08585 [Lentimicrobiaceae bacterium]|jgi:hypothetical protein|nr:hypothetical protein [Lentimicrobiaceae bacterium]
MDSYFLYRKAWIAAHAPHLGQKLSTQQSKKLLNRGGLFVRNIYNFDNTENKNFWYVIKDHFGGLDELSSRTRTKVRKALKTYDIRKINKEEMLQNGFSVFVAAAKKYKRKTRTLSEKQFYDLINQSKNTDFWMCFEKTTQNPVALAINSLIDNTCAYSILKTDPNYLGSTYPNYGLLFEMNRYYLDEQKMKYVNDGSRTITERSQIQQFLEKRFHFRKAYCNLTIHYATWMKPIVRVLYPCRKFIPLQNVRDLLNMESMHRGEK